jgi:hypothetical protein
MDADVLSARSDGSRVTHALEWLTPHRALVLAAALLGLAGLPAALLERQLRYDEIIYLSQFGAGLDPLTMTAPRAWGMPILLAPIGLLTTSALPIRLVLLAASVAGMYLAFRPWLSITDRWVAPAAAVLFGTLWTTWLFASMAYPNIWLAWLGVGGIGLALAILQTGGSRLAIVTLVGVFVVASLIRPTDALLVALPVIALALARRAWTVAAAVVGGVGVGWLAWLAEGFLRFGGPIGRLREASRVNDAGLFLDPRHLLRSADGPELLCRPISDCGRIDWIAVAWLIALPVLTALGIALARRRLPLIVAAMAAALLAAQYAFGFDWSSPRFLQPAFALLALPVGVLVVRVARKSPAALILLMVLLLAHGAIQARQLVGVVRQTTAVMTRTDAIVSAIHDAGVREPCVVFHPGSVGVGFESGCRPVPTGGLPAPSDPAVLRALEDGERVVIVSRQPAASPPAGWLSIEVPTRPAAALLISPAAP